MSDWQGCLINLGFLFSSDPNTEHSNTGNIEYRTFRKSDCKWLKTKITSKFY